MKLIFNILLIVSVTVNAQQYETTGFFERYDSAVNKIVSANAKAEIVAKGFSWSEGALWVEKYKMLLFSDVPANSVYKWTAEKGVELYLKPSGFSGTSSKSRETGSNGLTLNKQGKLVLCQQGDRRMAEMKASLENPSADYISLATHYNGKRFSSPNDCAFNDKEELYFTDPPYGLPTQSDKDPLRETGYNGVYKVKKDGTVILLVDSITKPNGIAFFPGYKKVLISSSDPEKPNWYVYDVEGDALVNGKIFFSVAGYDKRLHGLPDGLKIDSKGNVYATGPGGLYILNAEGKLLGKLVLNDATSNCSLSKDEKTIYITNNSYVLRFLMR
ncbi:MAG: gluconolactonase [Chitinophaga sp.]|jgi:gluconolactonase|nr:gluconolactonase [Chitinophaga sp.]